MGQLKRKLVSFLSAFKIKKRDRDSLKLIKWETRFLLFCLLLYITAFLYNWICVDQKADIGELRQFIVVIGGLTATFQFLSKWLVDKDNDGVPDEAVKDKAVPPAFMNKR